jgi:hypothetical protein
MMREDSRHVLAAILAIPKFANGLRVPARNIHARMGDRIRTNVDPATNDVILYLEPANDRNQA